MAARLVSIAPRPEGIYRLARRASGWFAPPDWSYAKEDGTFDNRFDDPSAARGVPPARRFRTIYAATERQAAFSETIAHFRPSLALLAKLAEIDDDDPLETALAGSLDSDDPARGIVRANWRLERRMDFTILDPTLEFVDLGNPETIQHLRRALAPLAEELGLVDVDLSAVTSQQLVFTQHCARFVYDQTGPSGEPRYAGIRYPSRFGEGWECWAIFDDRIRHLTEPGFPATIPPDDPDLIAVASLFRLTIEVLDSTVTICALRRLFLSPALGEVPCFSTHPAPVTTCCTASAGRGWPASCTRTACRGSAPSWSGSPVRAIALVPVERP